MKRAGSVVALLIFFFAFIVCGIAMIILDQMFQFSTSWGTANYPVGVYKSSTLTFYTDGEAYMGVIVIIALSVWLYIRSQESSVGVE